jgi:pyroglutamyl-peptidase
MTTTVLITGFGAFPGAPFNPTEALVEALVRCRHPTYADVRRLAHIFPVSYAAVDRDLPALVARERPDVLLMFGLAARTKWLRIETRARNVLNRLAPDAAGHIAGSATIAQDGPQMRALRVPALRLVRAAVAAGVPARISRDAGDYLCNYLCWCAAATAPRLTAFVHVPLVGRAPSARTPLTPADLLRAGEAILRAAIVEARVRR